MTDQISSDLASLRIDRSGSAPSSGSRTSPASASSSRRPAVVRVLVICGVLASVVAIGAVAVSRVQTQVLRQEISTTEVTVFSPSQAEVQVTATGYAIPQVTSKVGSKIGGRVAAVLVKEGDDVRAGDVLARLDDVDQRSSMTAASTRVAVARARVETARANVNEVSQQVERQRALVASGAVGKATLDDLVARETALKSVVTAAIAEAQSAGADVATFDVGLKDRVIVAPIAGRIVSKPITVGEFVGGVLSPTVVAEIVDFDSIMLEADVPEARLHLVKIGGPCEIVLDAYPNKRYRGIATELGQRVNRAKATVVVKIKFTGHADGVLPEMSARVNFLSKPISDEALAEAPKRVVSSDAVVERDGHKVVFVVDQGALHSQPVKVGGLLGSSIELIDGPAPGTKVVAHPTPDTADGQRIKDTGK